MDNNLSTSSDSDLMHTQETNSGRDSVPVGAGAEWMRGGAPCGCPWWISPMPLSPNISPYYALRAWHPRGAITIGALLGFAFILLVSCTSPASTKGTTPQRTPTTASIQSPTALPLTQQYDFTAQDSGKTVTYTITSRFEIFLNEQKYPKQNVEVSCHPQDTLGSVSNLPSVAPPLYVVRYEGVQPGVCIIKNGTFLLIVRMIALTQ